jgi:hypothetical protein
MARCSAYTKIDRTVGGHRVYSDNKAIKCECDYYKKNGKCRHAAEVINQTCSWKGEPNMTIIDNRPVKICPRCGSPVC